MLVAVGFLVGLHESIGNAIFGACVALLVFGTLYLFGAYERGKPPEPETGSTADGCNVIWICPACLRFNRWKWRREDAEISGDITMHCDYCDTETLFESDGRGRYQLKKL